MGPVTWQIVALTLTLLAPKPALSQEAEADPAAEAKSDVPSAVPEQAPAEAADPDRPAPASTLPVPLVRVALIGDLDAITLISGDERFPIPGKVPPGEYLMEALFGDEPAPAGLLTVSKGGLITLRCDARFAYCMERK